MPKTIAAQIDLEINIFVRLWKAIYNRTVAEWWNNLVPSSEQTSTQGNHEQKGLLGCFQSYNDYGKSFQRTESHALLF